MTLSEFNQSPIGAKLTYKHTGDLIVKESPNTIRLVNGDPKFTTLYSIIYYNVDNLPVIDVSLLELY
jgi:hypothetical protein